MSLGATPPGTGLIPASAGQTACPRRCATVSRAHPRECGADRRDPFDSIMRQGSSPRVRGTLRIKQITKRLLGLIPASAGQTTFKLVGTSWCGAHPRECGADGAVIEHLEEGLGSSPRVRGRRLLPQLLKLSRGLIPASAGQTGGGWP